jgi:hypothetical protein
MNEQKDRVISKNKEYAKKRLLSLLKEHPQVFQAGIGPEAFVDELNKAYTKYIQFSDDEIFAMEEISNIIIMDFPHIINQETGIEKFFDDLNKASIKYLEYFPKPKPTTN